MKRLGLSQRNSGMKILNCNWTSRAGLLYIDDGLRFVSTEVVFRCLTSFCFSLFLDKYAKHLENRNLVNRDVALGTNLINWCHGNADDNRWCHLLLQWMTPIDGKKQSVADGNLSTASALVLLFLLSSDFSLSRDSSHWQRL